MLNDFSWNMTGYIPKYQVNPHGDGIIPYVAERIFQLEPEPPAVSSLNEYILSASQNHADLRGIVLRNVLRSGGLYSVAGGGTSCRKNAGQYVLVL